MLSWKTKKTNRVNSAVPLSLHAAIFSSCVFFFFFGNMRRYVMVISVLSWRGKGEFNDLVLALLAIQGRGSGN